MEKTQVSDGDFLKNNGPSTLETTLPGKLLYRYSQVARALDLVRIHAGPIYAVSSLFPEDATQQPQG